MTGVAAGLAMQGFLPVTYTIAPFGTTRCLEQIRIDIAYHNLPVTIVSVGAGLSYASLGPTHHSCEDIAFLRSIPNMRIFCPATPFELEAILSYVFENPSPTYIRMGKKGEGEFHSNPIDSQSICLPVQVSKGESVCLIAVGTIIDEVVSAKKKLQDYGITAAIYSLPMVKPLPLGALKELFLTYSRIAIIEEHSLIGGVSSAISELVIDGDLPAQKLIRVGTPDCFFEEAGSQQFARRVMRISTDDIVRKFVD
jgi:transketolase